MKAILWSQGESPSSKDLMVIDGVTQEYNSTDEQKQAFDDLTSKKSWNEVSSKCLSMENSFRYYVKKHNMRRVYSHYLDRDVAGRPIVFMFQDRNPSVEDFYKSLRENSLLIHRLIGISLEDLIVLERRYDNNRKTKKAVVLVSIILIISLLCLLLHWIQK